MEFYRVGPSVRKSMWTLVRHPGAHTWGAVSRVHTVEIGRAKLTRTANATEALSETASAGAAT